MANYLITGANRGIGLALCAAVKQQGDQVIAVCRRSSAELDALDVQVETDVDMADISSVQQLAKRLAGTKIDVMICNAGIIGGQTLDNMDYDAVQHCLAVNAVGPLALVACLRNHLQQGSKIALITSRMGSIGDNDTGARYGYRMSKAALNAAGKSMAIDLAPRGISVIMIHPGYVKTDMSPQGPVPVAEAATNTLQRIAELNVDNSGRFLHQNGQELPW